MNIPSITWLLLLIVAVCITVALRLFVKRHRINSAEKTSIPQGSSNPYALPCTIEQQAQELEDLERAITLFEKALRSSPVVREAAIELFIGRLRESVEPFSRLNAARAYEDTAVLSLAEKRELGLNTRMKYSRGLIELFKPESLAVVEPRSFLNNLHLDVTNKVHRSRELNKMKALGISHVEIAPAGDQRDCTKIGSFRKVHAIESVPDLPVPGCNAAYCRCLYLAVLEKKPSSATK